ncbi:rhamnulokinase [Desulfovibrio inopinatus]|uniref:rhamnulokinase n=1 Tax=Desulfovibrio inopinatus TaxID=102109 RepID=UPI00042211EC|nr:rhamnulokinase [Desulfovibrio inopinatus]
MLKHQRHLAILNLLEKSEAISLEDLLASIDASESTLRRDIDELASLKKLKKVRGGVAPVKRELTESRLVTPPYLLEMRKNSRAKEAIGKAAAGLLRGTESIIINGGTTTWQMASSLPKDGLTILTNSLPLVEYVSTCTSNRCFVSGGEVFHHHLIILGHLQNESPNFFGEYFFTGCQGISPWGIMEGDPLLVHAEQRLINQSEKLVILADSSKFTKRKSIIMCPLERVHTCITDDNADEESIKMLVDAGIHVIIAPTSGGNTIMAKPTSRCLALDFGASSGRLISMEIENDTLHLHEITRMQNGPKQEGSHLVWPHERLFAETVLGLKKAGEQSQKYDSIGVDTWGVDYVLLDTNGQLLGQPVSYRDERTTGMIERFTADRMAKEDIYKRTGIQFLPFNTLYQLYAQSQTEPDVLRQAWRLLFTADYYHFLLSGQATVEQTMASTSQMWNLHEQCWDKTLLSALALPESALQNPVSPGTMIGELLPWYAETTGLTGLKVIAPASHDTASAVMAAPAIGDDWAYLSSGTWSLLGIESATPIVNDQAMDANWTNEAGYGGTYRFLKNITGLWIIQQIAHEYQGRFTFAELASQAEASPGFVSIISPNDDRFFSPSSMIQAIQTYCQDSGQPVPQTPGALTRCAYDSLSLYYRKALEDLRNITGKTINTLHVVGGGSQATFLNRLTAASMEIPVLAGPVEATAIGNGLAQFMATGTLQSLAQARELVARSFSLTRFEPEKLPGLDAAYQRFLTLFAQNQ